MKIDIIVELNKFNLKLKELILDLDEFVQKYN